MVSVSERWVKTRSPRSEEENRHHTLNFTKVKYKMLDVRMGMISFLIAYLVVASFLISVDLSKDAYGSFPGVPSDETSSYTTGMTSSYTKNATVSIEPFDNSAATALCENGDVFKSAGYHVGSMSPESLNSIFIYVDQPVHQETETTSQDGWRIGLVNNQNRTVTITASVLCADVTP